MASDGAASPLLGLDVNMKPGAALSPTVLPFPLPTPDQLDQPSWEPSPQPPIPSAFSPGNPLVLSAFANPVLVTGDGSPNPTGAGTGKVIIKVKTEAGLAEPSQTQNFILTQTALNWIASSAPCGGSEGSPARYMATSNVKTILPTQAVGVSQEGPPGLPPQALPPAAQLAPILPLEKAWLGPQGATGEGGPVAAGKPSLGELAYTSKGVYENFRRWQCYKALARRHLSQSPDTEALSCFLIPVLRSLAQLKPTMTLEEGLPRAVQEWEHTSNFDRMIFYEMAEKFMEFEAEEEQIQNAQLMNGSHGLSPAAPLKLDPPGSLAPEACQLPALPSVYIPKKAACKSRAPRRRQRKPRRLPAPEAPKEIPPEAVKEYIDIMEGLAGSQSDTVASGGKQEEEQQEDEGSYPDPCLLSYVDELCSQEVFVSKVEAVIHPQFLADLLSPEEQRDPLALIEELEQEEGLTIAQLVQKRLLALEEDEDMQAPPSCSGAQSDSSPSVSDEDEDGGGRPRPTPGPRGSGATVCLGKAASPGKRAREMHGGLERALGGPRGMHKDGNPQLSSSSWDRQLKLAPSQVVQPSLGMERRGSGEVMNQLSSHKDGYLGGAGSPGHCLVADRTSEALSLCWQEGPQPLRALSVDVGLADPAPVQGQVLEKQVLGLQTGQQMGVLEVLPRGTEPSAVSQEESLAAMWENDAGPSMVQSYDQNAPPGAAGDQDRALSPALWLSSEMDAVSLELPLQIEEVIESFENGECIAKHQALDSTNSISLSGEGESTVFLPSGTTDAAAAIELPEPLGTNSPALGPKENREQSPGTIQDTSDLWADGCSPLLEITEASTLGSPKDALLPSCQDNLFILGTQDAFFPQASQEAESTGNPFSPLEATEHINTLDVTDDCGFQLGVSEDSCLANFNSYDLQGEGREDSSPSSPKPNDLVSLQGNQESYILETPKSTSYLSLGSTSPTWDALVPGENSFSEALNSVDGVQKREKEEEEEDEQLSNFAYLLASKLSLSPRGLPLSPHPVSGGQGIQKASHPCAEVQGPGQLSHPVTKSGKRAPVGGLANAVKRPQPGAQLGVSGENPLALGMVQSSQPRKRRRDSFATGRKKKRRRSQ